MNFIKLYKYVLSISVILVVILVALFVIDDYKAREEYMNTPHTSEIPKIQGI